MPFPLSISFSGASFSPLHISPQCRHCRHSERNHFREMGWNGCPHCIHTREQCHNGRSKKEKRKQDVKNFHLVWETTSSSLQNSALLLRESMKLDLDFHSPSFNPYFPARNVRGRSGDIYSTRLTCTSSLPRLEIWHGFHTTFLAWN